MSTDMMMLMGSAVTEMTVVRRFIRKKNSTIITNSAPSSRASQVMSGIWRARASSSVASARFGTTTEKTPASLSGSLAMMPRSVARLRVAKTAPATSAKPASV